MAMTDPVPYLKRIPLFQETAVDTLLVERLGGLTNLVYRVQQADRVYLLRIPGQGTQEYIDRQAEAGNARVAADAGVSAAVLYFDETDGLMLADYIEGTTLDEDGFKNPGSLARAAVALHRMHQHPHSFRTHFDVFEKIDEYLQLLDKLGAPLPDGYRQVKREADAVRRVLQANPVAQAPCHCDPLAENFIDTGKQVYIVDWEYAGNNDPMWDLGDLSIEAGFDENQEQLLMETYFGGKPPAAQLGRMVMYKMLGDLLWTLWGIVQHVNGNPAEDFWAYALNRYQRCRQRMEDPEFMRHLKAI